MSFNLNYDIIDTPLCDISMTKLFPWRVLYFVIDDEYSIKHQSNNKSWKFGSSRGQYNPLYWQIITIISLDGCFLYFIKSERLLNGCGCCGGRQSCNSSNLTTPVLNISRFLMHHVNILRFVNDCCCFVASDIIWMMAAIPFSLYSMWHVGFWQNKMYFCMIYGTIHHFIQSHFINV